MSEPKSKEQIVKQRKIIVLSAFLLILFLIIFIPTMVIRNIRNKNAQDQPVTDTFAEQDETETQAVNYKNLSPLTGLPDFKAEGKRPVAFMINNSKPARPQWGLCTPDIVFEAITEGGITRMLWVYADSNNIPDKIGSMRSARHDFIEIAEGMDALFVHWGGSKYAYNAFKSRDIDHLDGLVYAEKLFFRDPNRNVSPEHRGYTTQKNVLKGFKQRRARTEIDKKYSKPFIFNLPNEVKTPMGGSCSSVYFEFSKYCNHTFKYDKDKVLYYNYINSEPMKDSDGIQMAVTNVIILSCAVSQMGDDAGCVDMDLSSGTGIYISNGGYENITWEKGSPSSPLKLYNQNKDELSLNAGKSYIAIIPNSRSSATSISE